MSDYTSGNINFTGLGSGTDFKELVDGLMKLERVHINRLEKWKSTWSDKVEKFQELNTALLGLQTTLKSMDTLDEFMSKTVTTSDSGTLTATATAEALVTSHAVEIGQLAKNDIHVTDTTVSKLTDSVFSAEGKFTFSYGGESVTLSGIPANTSLQGFVNLINSHVDSRSKIRATTINDGTGYHLQLYGLDLGSDNQVIVSNTVGMVFNASNFQETQNAQNSRIKVDGYPINAADWIERDSNTVSDVIDGVTLNLKNTNTAGSTTTIGIATDKEGMKENVQKFVDQNNEIRKMIKDLTSVTTSSDSASGSILTGNYGVELLVGQRLKDIMASKGVGFSWYEELASGDFTGDKYSALSQVGILTNADTGGATMGMLELDTDELNKALDDDPTAVAMLFAANYAGSTNSPNLQYLSHISGTTKAGEYNVQYKVSGGAITEAFINGQPALIDAANWQITGAGGTDAAGMALRVENRTDGDYGSSNSEASNAISVFLKQGKSGELVEALDIMTGDDGPLEILQDNYDTIMKNIDKKIASEEDRLELKKRTLTMKYSRLDALLGNYQGKTAQLTASVAQLMKN